MNREEIISYDSLYESYTKCRRGVSWKPTVLHFILNDVTEVFRMSEKLKDGRWKSSRPKPILITYPKVREGLSIPFKDRVYQRSINDLSLYPQCTRSFIFDNCACQKGKGTSFARRRMKEHLRRWFMKHGDDGWVLQIDVKSYYPTMDHQTVYSEFARYVPPDVHEMVTDVLRAQYVGDTGFNPGSQMVQIAGISVLNRVDHFIKEKLRVKHYIRYMDDFFILVETFEQADFILSKVSQKLSELKFRVHPKKTHIKPLSDGFDFLGFTYRMTETGKIVMTVKSDIVRHEKRKLRRLVALAKKGGITPGKVQECYDSWRTYVSEGDSWKLTDRMDEYLNYLWRTV